MPKIFSSFTHGWIDYVLGVALLLAPYLFGFADVGVAMLSAQAIGVLILGQSLLTKYELGLLKVIPFRTHLAMDILASAFLAVSPFVLGFYDYTANVWVPHLTVGIAYLLISLTTTSEVGTKSEHSGREAHV